MYTLLKSSTPRQLASNQLPSLLASMIIAELFYKLGSFTLECAALFATWFAIDFVADRTVGALLPERRHDRSRAGT